MLYINKSINLANDLKTLKILDTSLYQLTLKHYKSSSKHSFNELASQQFAEDLFFMVRAFKLSKTDMIQKLTEGLGSGTKNTLNQKRIITHLMHNHSSTIPDLAKDIDLSIPTVTKFVMELVDEGVYYQLREARNKRRKTS